MKKVAIVTENGTRISSHFGSAPLFKIFTIENGKVIGEEDRQKTNFGGHQHGHADDEHRHDEGHHQHGKGAQMFLEIADCQVLICGGMGQPAFEKAQNAGLEIFLSGGEIDAALNKYITGELGSDERRIHKH